MKNTKIESLVYKKAYFVPSWGDKIQTGQAFILTYNDWYEKKSAFFIENGKDIPKIIDAKQVVFSAKESIDLLDREIKAHKAFYTDQIKEYTEKLNNLSHE